MISKLKFFVKLKQMSEQKKSITYNIIATICGWIALCFSVSAVFINYWLTDNRLWSAGLWFVCNKTKCLTIAEYPGK